MFMNYNETKIDIILLVLLADYFEVRINSKECIQLYLSVYGFNKL